MPNVPIRDHTNKAQYPTPRQSQYNTSQMQRSQPRQGQHPQRPQVAQVPVKQLHYERSARPNGNLRQSAEQLRPMKPSAPRQSQKGPLYSKKNPAPKKKVRRSKDRTTLGDFFLSFIVALLVFGIAAIFVCNALISLFT